MGRQISTQTSPSFGIKVHALFGVDRGGSLIVYDGGDCRCEVSLQSYSPCNVELVSPKCLLLGGLGDFSVRGRDLQTFGVHY